MEYPGLQITAAQEGAHLDMRVRIAIQLASSRGFAAFADRIAGAPNPAPLYAKLALDAADEIVKQSAARGWVVPLTELDESLSRIDEDHVKRNARAQVIQQITQHEVGQELAPAVRAVRGAGPFSQ